MFLSDKPETVASFEGFLGLIPLFINDEAEKKFRLGILMSHHPRKPDASQAFEFWELCSTLR